MKDHYQKTVSPKLKEEFNIKNIHALPRVTKIVVNVGIGSYLQREGKKDLNPLIEDIKKITGQKPSVRKARKAISNFKLREGMPVGIACTLRGKRMYDFMSRLVNIVMPRIRDFQGISAKSFDGKGNYNVGIKEHIIFPEIDIDNVDKTYSLQINVTTTAANDYHGYRLLKEMGFPFKNELTPNNK